MSSPISSLITKADELPQPEWELPYSGTASLPCHREDPELWFADSPQGLERAKALCTQCPLRKECLQGALERQEPWGVWGGEIFEQGVVIARKRSRGRPPKVVVE